MRYKTICAKIKLKPNSLERVHEWAKMLHKTMREEALDTLRDETVILESYFLDQTSEGDFLIAFMKVEDTEQAQRAFENSIHEIDQYHKEFKKDVWESRQPLELLVDLDRINELAHS